MKKHVSIKSTLEILEDFDTKLEYYLKAIENSQ